MDYSAFFERVLFSFGEKEFTVLHIFYSVLAIIVIAVLYRITFKNLLPRYFKSDLLHVENHKKVKKRISTFFYLLILIALVWSLEIDYVFYENKRIQLSIIDVIEGLLIFQFARLLDWIISRTLIYNFYRRHDKENNKDIAFQMAPEQSANRIVKSVLIIFVIIIFLRVFYFDYTLFSYDEYEVTIGEMLGAALILLSAQLISWVTTQLILHSYYQRKEIDTGSQFAINQLVKYVIFIFAIFLAIEHLGVHMTVLWGGMAALLVGIGLGLQQTFNDLFSGIMLLFERGVEIEDVVEVDGLVGKVKRIGLRTSIVETRDNVSVIVPNSKLVTNSVVNWSHSDHKVRFKISVGVAYGSDTEKVKELLLKVAKENVYVLEFPSSLVRFINFGNSSLDFELLFWSKNLLIIEDIKSDLRFKIDKEFRENKITIPFPQRDVWFKNSPER